MSRVRLAVLAWGAVITTPLAAALVRAWIGGFDPFDLETSPSPGRLSIALLVSGLLIIVSATKGRRAVAWALLCLTAVVVGLAVAVNADAGAWWDPLWRPIVMGAAVGVPAALLLGGEARQARTRTARLD